MAIWGPYHGDATTKEVNVTVYMTASLKLSSELLFVSAAACPDSFLRGKSAYVPLAFLLLNANWFAGSPLSYAVPSIPGATEIWLAWVSEYTQNTPQPAIWNSTRPQLHPFICWTILPIRRSSMKEIFNVCCSVFCIEQWERRTRLMGKLTKTSPPWGMNRHCWLGAASEGTARSQSSY